MPARLLHDRLAGMNMVLDGEYAWLVGQIERGLLDNTVMPIHSANTARKMAREIADTIYAG